MNDIEYELQKEIQEKKLIARSAKNGVRGSRSKKCTLPYEIMSRKESGGYMQASEVETFQLRPMTRKEYDATPDDKKKELLLWYGEKYGWSSEGVAAALGVRFNTAKRKIAELSMMEVFNDRARLVSREERRAQMARRKALLNASQKEPEQIQPQDKLQSEPSAPNDNLFFPLILPPYLAKMNCEKPGKILMAQLRGMAESLDPDEEYSVELTIRARYKEE